MCFWRKHSELQTLYIQGCTCRSAPQEEMLLLHGESARKRNQTTSVAGLELKARRIMSERKYLIRKIRTISRNSLSWSIVKPSWDVMNKDGYLVPEIFQEDRILFNCKIGIFKIKAIIRNGPNIRRMELISFRTIYFSMTLLVLILTISGIALSFLSESSVCISTCCRLLSDAIIIFEFEQHLNHPGEQMMIFPWRGRIPVGISTRKDTLFANELAALLVF